MLLGQRGCSLAQLGGAITLPQRGRVRTYHGPMSSSRQSEIDTRTCTVSQTLYRTRLSLTGADCTTDKDNLDGGKPKRFNISHKSSSLTALNWWRKTRVAVAAIISALLAELNMPIMRAKKVVKAAVTPIRTLTESMRLRARIDSTGTADASTAVRVLLARLTLLLLYDLSPL